MTRVRNLVTDAAGEGKLTTRQTLGTVFLHGDVCVEVVESAVTLGTPGVVAAIHALDFVVPSPCAFLWLAGQWDKRVDLVDPWHKGAAGYGDGTKWGIGRRRADRTRSVGAREQLAGRQRADLPSGVRRANRR
jgi:hypothetical protein